MYGQRCLKCQEVKQVFIGAALEVKQQQLPVKLSIIDCNQHRKACVAHGVRGYPTLAWFEDGQLMDRVFNGDKKYKQVEDMMHYVNSRLFLQKRNKEGEL